MLCFICEKAISRVGVLADTLVKFHINFDISENKERSMLMKKRKGN